MEFTDNASGPGFSQSTTSRPSFGSLENPSDFSAICKIDNKIQLPPKHYKVNNERQGRMRGEKIKNSCLKENDGYLLKGHFLALEFSWVSAVNSLSRLATVFIHHHSPLQTLRTMSDVIGQKRSSVGTIYLQARPTRELSLVQCPTGSSLLLYWPGKWKAAGYPHVWDITSKIQSTLWELCLSLSCRRHKALALKFGCILEFPTELILMTGSDPRDSDSLGMGCALRL